MSLIYQSDTMVQGQRPALYLGGKSDAKNREKLKERKVTHILNMTPPKEVSIMAGVPNYFQSEFTYKRIAVYDSSTSVTNLLEAADDIVAFIAKALHHGSCLVHCQRGVSRSTTAVLFYLMRRVGMPLDDALALIQRRRPDAEPIPDFMDMLRQYEAQCRRDGAIVDQVNESSRKHKKRTAAAAAGPASKTDVGPQKRFVVGPAPGPVNVAVGPLAHPSRSIGPAVEGQDESLNDRASSPSTFSNASCRNRKH